MEDERVWFSTWAATLSKTSLASLRRALWYRRGWYQNHGNNIDEPSV